MIILGWTISMPVFWLIVAIVFAIIEGLTMGLTTIWFTGGAIVALAAAFLGASTPVQVVIFFVVSIVLLILTRKIFVRKLHTGNEKTNVDALLGREAVITEEIKAFSPGIIKLNGQEWTAILEENQGEAPVGQIVTVVRIEGVKAVVKPVEKK